ncbi:MAG TPA: UrcA family protein [Caulobacteraceae bacterium]|jgi:UrcA family protein
MNIRIFAIAAAIASIGAAAQADGLKVPVGALNSPDQARSFDQRLDAAAQQFCAGRYGPAALDEMATCKQAIRDEAVAQLTPAQQQAYAAARRPATALASNDR